jgi:hypothetical protein
MIEVNSPAASQDKVLVVGLPHSPHARKLAAVLGADTEGRVAESLSQAPPAIVILSEPPTGMSIESVMDWQIDQIVTEALVRPWQEVRDALKVVAPGGNILLLILFSGNLSFTDAYEALIRCAAIEASLQAKPVRVNAVYASADTSLADVVAAVKYLIDDEAGYISGTTMKFANV